MDTFQLNHGIARTYVLVHGAWHDGSAWRKIVPLLTAAGHRVYAPSLTGHGEKAALLGPELDLETHATLIVNLIEEEDLGDVVLVGHSYAGMVISAVANRVPDRIASMIYVDAMVPLHGESAADVIPATNYMIAAASESAEPWRIPPLPEMPPPAGLYGVTDPSDTEWLRRTLSYESVLCFTQPVAFDNPAQTSIDRAHIHCVGFEPDGFVRRSVPHLQPNGAPARVAEIVSGHDCMIIAPEDLTCLLMTLVNE